MFEALMDRVERFMDAASEFIWEQFERDMIFTDKVIAHGEALGEYVKKFFRGPSA